jgi:hypothetical protein
MEIKEAYFPNDLLMCQDFYLPLCGPLQAASVCSLTPPRNVDFSETSHNTVYYLLEVK